MEKKDAVSLWVGHTKASDDLNEYMEVEYPEEEDDEEDDGSIPSQFARDFDLPYYDEDFQEFKFRKVSSDSIRALLKGHSYDDVLIPKFIQLIGESLPESVNVVILLYNFEYDGPIQKNEKGKVKVRYMGSISLE